MATYKVYADVVVGVVITVEAENEQQAVKICEDGTYMEAYANGTVGIEGYDDDIESVDMDTLDEPRWHEALAEEV